jgi:hypothetical protein
MIYPGKVYRFEYDGNKAEFAQQFEKFLNQWVAGNPNIRRRFGKRSRANSPLSGHMEEDKFEIRQLDENSSDGYFLLRGSLKERDNTIEVKLKVGLTNYFLSRYLMTVAAILVAAFTTFYILHRYEVLVLSSWLHIAAIVFVVSLYPGIKSFQSLAVIILNDFIDWFNLK